MSLFSTTKTFSVLIPKNSKNPVKDIKLVKESGFNFIAAFFKLFWALYNRMWLCASLLFLTQAILVYLRLNNIIDFQLVIILDLALLAIIGFNSNDWKLEDLKSKNYVFMDVVLAIDELQAKEKFLRSYVNDDYYKKEEVLS